MQTVLQELIDELESIKLTKCKTLQELVFFDGILAIIEDKYLEKEKEQIITAYNQDLYCGLYGTTKYEDGNDYYNNYFNFKN